MTSIAVYTRLVAKPHRREDLATALQPFLDNVLSEPGALCYALHLDAADDDAIWFYSLFRDQEALAEHRRNEVELAARFPGVGPLLSESSAPVQVEGSPISMTFRPSVGRN